MSNALARSPHRALRLIRSQPQPLWMTLCNPEHFRTLKELAQVLVASQYLPKTVNTVEKALAIMIKGAELQVPPMEAFGKIDVISGKPVVAPQLLLAMVERAGILEDIEIVGDETQCTVTMKRRGRKPYTARFSVADAERLTWFDHKADAWKPLLQKRNWREQPGTMCMWRAVGKACRVVAPDVTMGLYTAEELGATVEIDEDGDVKISELPAATPDEDSAPAATVPPAEHPTVSTTAIAPLPAAASTPADTPNSGPTNAAVPESAAAPAVQASTTLSADDFNTLIRKAALLEKTKGATPGLTWLKTRFGVSDPTQLTPEQRAAAVQLAQEIVAKAARGKHAPANAEPTPPSTSAPVLSPPAMASAQQIETVQAIAAKRGWTSAQLAAQIRNFTGDRRTPQAAKTSAADLTDREATAFIDEFGRGLDATGRRSA